MLKKTTDNVNIPKDYVNIPTDNLNNFFSDNSEPSFFITDNVTNKKIILNSRKISLNV